MVLDLYALLLLKIQFDILHPDVKMLREKGGDCHEEASWASNATAPTLGVQVEDGSCRHSVEASSPCRGYSADHASRLTAQGALSWYGLGEAQGASNNPDLQAKRYRWDSPDLTSVHGVIGAATRR